MIDGRKEDAREYGMHFDSLIKDTVGYLKANEVSKKADAPQIWALQLM